MISSIDVYPSEFKFHLEDLMVIELTRKDFNYIPVYYDSYKPEELKFSEFDKNLWLLSESTQMSEDVLLLMDKYR